MLGNEEELNQKPPLLPTAVDKEYRQVTINLLEAEDLPDMDRTILDELNIFQID
jgi:hypothetical protein